MRRYNAALCLRELYEHVDAIVGVPNERITSYIESDKIHTSSRGDGNAAHSIADMNEYVAECVRGLYEPFSSKARFLQRSFIDERLRHLVPDPQCKLVEIWTAHKRCVHTQHEWRGLGQSARGLLPKYGVNVLAAEVMARGDGATDPSYQG